MPAPTSRSIRRSGAAAALAIAVQLLASPSGAGDPVPVSKDEACSRAAGAQPQPASPTASGMRVSIDPATGEYRQAPDAAAPAGAHVTAAAAAPRPTPLPGGGELLDTRGFRHEITATAKPDGRLETNCAQTEKAAAPVE
jgi:hypothetical protein